jgi:hypothetical protein
MNLFCFATTVVVRFMFFGPWFCRSTQTFMTDVSFLAVSRSSLFSLAPLLAAWFDGKFKSLRQQGLACFIFHLVKIIFVQIFFLSFVVVTGFIFVAAVATIVVVTETVAVVPSSTITVRLPVRVTVVAVDGIVRIAVAASSASSTTLFVFEVVAVSVV